MAINMDKMRARFEASENKGKGQKKEDDGTFKPQEGDQDIRLLPAPDGDPVKDVWVHYNLGKKNSRGVFCPNRSLDKDCAICEFATSMWKEGTDESKKMAKSLFARQRFYSPVLDRNDEAKGCKVWWYGNEAYKQLLKFILKPDYGDITDVDEGTDVTLTYTKPKTKTEYPKTELVPRRKNSPLSTKKGEVKKILDSIPDLLTLFPSKTPAEVKDVLKEYLDAPQDEDAAEFNYGANADTKDETITGVDQAIDELTS